MSEKDSRFTVRWLKGDIAEDIPERVERQCERLRQPFSIVTRNLLVEWLAKQEASDPDLKRKK